MKISDKSDENGPILMSVNELLQGRQVLTNVLKSGIFQIQNIDIMMIIIVMMMNLILQKLQQLHQ